MFGLEWRIVEGLGVYLLPGTQGNGNFFVFSVLQVEDRLTTQVSFEGKSVADYKYHYINPCHKTLNTWYTQQVTDNWMLKKKKEKAICLPQGWFSLCLRLCLSLSVSVNYVSWRRSVCARERQTDRQRDRDDIETDRDYESPIRQQKERNKEPTSHTHTHTHTHTRARAHTRTHRRTHCRPLSPYLNLNRLQM